MVIYHFELYIALFLMKPLKSLLMSYYRRNSLSVTSKPYVIKTAVISIYIYNNLAFDLKLAADGWELHKTETVCVPLGRSSLNSGRR